MRERIVYPEGLRPKEGNRSDGIDRYDLLVVGAGAAGLTAAVEGARMGARVALIESSLLGGERLHSGCVPSKTFVASGRRIQDVKDSFALGVSVGDVSVDFQSVRKRMSDLRSLLGGEDSALRLLSEGVDVFPGRAVFDSPRSVTVEGRELEFTRAIIATGSVPMIPPIPGLNEVDYLTDETVFDLEELPRSMVVLGGGAMGCELAQAFRRLGSSVTLIQDRRCLLPYGEPEASGMIRRALGADGVDLRLGVDVLSIEDDDGELVLKCSSGDGEFQVRGERLLLATGRVPRLEGLGLDEAGIEWRDGIKVDRYLKTENQRVFCAGDICLTPCSTHGAILSAKIALKNAFLPVKRTYDPSGMTHCVYTTPEVAYVGVTLDQALAEGKKVSEIKVNLKDMDRSRIDGATEGFLKVVVNRRGRILGATLVAPRAGDMISELALAMHEGIKLGDLSWVPHPYPTEAAVFRRAADIWRGRTMTPLKRSILQIWMVLLSKVKDRAQREELKAAKRQVSTADQQPEPLKLETSSDKLEDSNEKLE